MRAPDLLRGAMVEIRAHKARSALTCVSLTIGIAAALYTLSQVAAASRRMRQGIELGGPGRMELRRTAGTTSRGLSKGVTYADARAIRERFPELYMVRPERRRWGLAFSAGAFKAKQLVGYGVDQEWGRRDWVYRLRGRFISARDVAEAARVCVLVETGDWIRRPWWALRDQESAYQKYLRRHDLLGRWVALDDTPFRVIGVLKEPPPDLDHRWYREWGGDGKVLVPITAMNLNLLANGERNPDLLDRVVIDTGDPSTTARYRREIDKLISFRHRGEKDYELKDYRELMAGALENLRKRLASIAAIGLVAILAGGIGILNVTLATVFSRVREIGVRRALGATRADIVAQFVCEAMILGAVSGVLGSALGAAGVLFFAPNERQVEAFEPAHALASTAAAVLVAFLFSVVPAWQASRMDPVQSLRYE